TARPRSSALNADQLHEGLVLFAPELGAAMHVTFGEVAVKPAIEVLPILSDPSGPLSVVVRLSGNVPHDAGPFAWKYDLTYAAYSLAIVTPHGDAPRQWLDGDATSQPFALDATLVTPSRIDVIRQYLLLGFTHIVPLGLDHILFVLGMFLLSTRIRP